MKVSIITATYNSAPTIISCINSVNNQTYNNIEHIIIDGGSVDGTLSIINSIPNRVNFIVSEPDYGIYDAMNKGIINSSGEIIGILNSDDFYTHINVITEICSVFQEISVECVYGDVNYVKYQNPDLILRRWKSGIFKNGSFQKGWHPAHPAFFVKRTIYEKYGMFNLKYKLAADFELMLRLLEKEKISNTYYDQVLVNMRTGGATNSSLKNIIKQNIECYQAFKDNEIHVSSFYPLLRLVPKLKQYL